MAVDPRHAGPAAQSRLAIAEQIPSKTEARSQAVHDVVQHIGSAIGGGRCHGTCNLLLAISRCELQESEFGAEDREQVPIES